MAIVFPGGTQAAPAKIVQVVNLTKTDAFRQTTTSSWQDISGYTASIAKLLSSSQVLVMMMVNLNHSDSYAKFGIRLTRNGTPIGVGTSVSNRIAATLGPHGAGHSGYGPHNYCINILDSPGSGTFTYALQHVDFDGFGQWIDFNRGGDDSDNNSFCRTASTITLMEVAS